YAPDRVNRKSRNRTNPASQIRNHKSQIARVQFTISDFGFKMQDLFNFEIFHDGIHFRRSEGVLVRSKHHAMCCVVLVLFISPLAAEDGAPLLKHFDATCHDSGLERAPSREAFRAMTPERVLTAMESGAMISMASGRTGVERRDIAEYVT